LGPRRTPIVARSSSSPISPRPAVNLGICHQENGDIAAAKTAYRLALKLRPDTFARTAAAPGARCEVRGIAKTGGIERSSKRQPSASHNRSYAFRHVNGGGGHNEVLGFVWDRQRKIACFYRKTGRFSKKNREAIKHEPGNRPEDSGAYIDFSKNK
jgi:hypothetical protein